MGATSSFNISLSARTHLGVACIPSLESFSKQQTLRFFCLVPPSIACYFLSDAWGRKGTAQASPYESLILQLFTALWISVFCIIVLFPSPQLPKLSTLLRFFLERKHVPKLCSDEKFTSICCINIFPITIQMICLSGNTFKLCFFQHG